MVADMAIPIPEREAERLEFLRALDILDTGSEPGFEAAVRLAADLCDAPVALVSLVDADRQWMKATVGVDVCELARSDSFCAHAIVNTTPMVVPDTLEDPRFVGNPFVAGEPHVRFYAGIPLHDESNLAVGTLCILDVRPRTLTASMLRSLELIAAAVVDMMLARRVSAKGRGEQLSILASAVEHASDPLIVFDVDADGTSGCRYVNNAFSALFGYEESEMLGKTLAVLYGAQTDLALAARLEGSIASGEIGSTELRLVDRFGSHRTMLVGVSPVPDDERAAPCCLATLRDVSDERNAAHELRTERERFRSLFEQHPDAVVAIDVERRFTNVNAATVAMTGYSASELRGQPVERVIGSDTRSEALDAFRHSDSAGATYCRSVVKRKDGGTIEVVLAVVPIVVNERFNGFYVLSHDVTVEERLKSEIKAQADRTRALYEIAAGHAEDPSAQIDAALALALKMLGVDSACVAERCDESATIVNIVGSMASLTVGDRFELEDSLMKGAIASGELRALDDPSDPRWHDGSVRLIPGITAYLAVPLAVAGRPFGAIGFVAATPGVRFSENDRDFARLVSALVGTAIERRQHRDRLDSLAFFDSLTGLPNRPHVLERLEREIERSTVAGVSFAVHFLDLDGFKSVNDAGGHEAGDTLLRVTARRLQTATRDGDLIGRFGGDEFVIVQPNVASPREAASLANRVLTVMRRPFDIADRTYRVSTSVGIAVYPQDGVTARDLLARADAALYAAKTGGKNCVVMRSDEGRAEPAESATALVS